jgi:hypothetical protein
MKNNEFSGVLRSLKNGDGGSHDSREWDAAARSTAS